MLCIDAKGYSVIIPSLALTEMAVTGMALMQKVVSMCHRL